jgi:hypothetical protein
VRKDGRGSARAGRRRDVLPVLAEVLRRIVGPPIRKKLRKFQSSNIDQVVLLNQAGKNTHEHICESLELFAKEVMPEFHEAHPKLLKWKEQVLNREIDLEEIDTTAFKERYGGNMKNIAPVNPPKVQAAE